MMQQEEIRSLRAEVGLLRAALKPFADMAVNYEKPELLPAAPDAAEIGVGHLTVGDIRRAAAAFKNEQPASKNPYAGNYAAQAAPAKKTDGGEK